MYKVLVIPALISFTGIYILYKIMKARDDKKRREQEIRDTFYKYID